MSDNPVSPVSTETRNEVWYQLLNAMRAARYYGKLSSRMSFWSIRLVWFLMFFATSAVVSLLDVMPDWVRYVANVAIWGVALWMLVNNSSHKLAVVRGVFVQCLEMETEVKWLWLNLDKLSDSEARQKFIEMERKATLITSEPENVGIAIDEHINKAADKEVQEEVRKYAA